MTFIAHRFFVYPFSRSRAKKPNADGERAL